MASPGLCLPIAHVRVPGSAPWRDWLRWVGRRNQIGGYRPGKCVGRGLTQGYVQLELCTVVVHDGVEVGLAAAVQQAQAVKHFDGQPLPIPGPEEVLLEGALARLDGALAGL